MHTEPSEVAAIDPQPDPDVYVRRGAAENPSFPAEALAVLAKDSDVDVRRGAAENPSCPAEALAALAGVRLSEATTPDGAPS